MNVFYAIPKTKPRVRWIGGAWEVYYIDIENLVRASYCYPQESRGRDVFRCVENCNKNCNPVCL